MFVLITLFSFQKFHNVVKSDLICPKCNGLDCDCYPPEENPETVQVLTTANLKNNIIPYEYNTTNASISRNNTEVALNGNHINNHALPR